MTKTQCRAARAILGWSQAKLAERAGVGLSTVREFEAGRRDPYDANMSAMRGALSGAGVEFLDGDGVKLRK